MNLKRLKAENCPFLLCSGSSNLTKHMSACDDSRGYWLNDAGNPAPIMRPLLKLMRSLLKKSKTK